MSAGSTPTFREFVAAVFGPDFDPKTIHVASFEGDPHVKEDAKWHGHRLADLTAGYLDAPYAEQNHFICMGVLDPSKIGRSLGLVREHSAFWMDDVGTKVPKERVDKWIADTGLEPNAIIETSPGNFSYVWGLASRVKADGGFEDQTVAAIRHQMKLQGWGDPATQEPARYMRSGFGVNGKKKYADNLGNPFPLRFERFQNLTHVTLEQFAENMIGPDWASVVASGAFMSSGQIAAQGGGGGVSSLDRHASMDDPIVKLAQMIGLDPQPSTRAGVIDAHCPNESAHTGGDPTGFAFINLDGMCFCNHASCGHLNSLDFREMIITEYDREMLAGELFGNLSEVAGRPDKLCDPTTGEEFFRSGHHFLAVEAFKVAAPVNEDVGSVVAEANAMAKRHGDIQKIMDDVDASKVDALFGRYVHVDDAEAFWDRETGDLVSPDRLCKDEKVLEVFKYTTGEKRASTQLLNSGGRLEHVNTVVNRPYRADQPPATDITTIKARRAKKKVKSAVNMFKPTEIGMRPGTPQEYLDHLAYLFRNQPDVERYLLEYMAFRLQFPDEQTSVIPIIGGLPGIGKDAQLLQPFFRLLGLHNVSELSASKLVSDFNDFLTSPTLYLGEFSMEGHEGKALYDRLKHYTSNDPVPVDINPKYGKTYKTEVSPCFIATTNDRESLEHVPTEDRRFLIAWSDADPRPQSYYEKLSAAYDPETPAGLANLEVLHWFLLNYKLTVFDPNKAPPRTEARHDTLVSSLRGVAHFVYEIVADGDLSHRTVISFKEIEARCLASSNPAVRNNVSARNIATGLKAAGCAKLDKVRIVAPGTTARGTNQMVLYTGACVMLGDGKQLLGSVSPARREMLRGDKDEAAKTFLAEVAKDALV